MLNRVIWWPRRRMKRGSPTGWRICPCYSSTDIDLSRKVPPPPLEGLFVWRTEWRSVYVCVCILGRGGGEGGVWMETAFRYISIIALSTHDMSYLWQRSVDVDDLISPNLGPRTRSALGCHVVCGGCQRFGGTECTSKRTHFIFLQKSPFPR